MRVAEQYIEAFGEIGKKSRVTLLPGNIANPASMITKALDIYKSMMKKNSGDD